MAEHLIEICTAIDGKKYKERVAFGLPFLSRHKEKCRQRQKDGTYVMYTYDKKENEKIINICKGCGYKINASYHFPEDEINI